MPACIEWAEERTRECAQTEDQGYRDCCEWAPCSWFCDAWVWVSNVVCVLWTWITTVVCVAWDVVTTILNAILVTLESIIGWVISALAFIIELIEMIPVLGTLVRWVLNFITFLIATVLSIIDAVLGFLGIRPEKILRVCTVILRDEDGNPVATKEFARAMLQLAVDVYKRDANVRIVPLGPFKYSTGFLAAEQVNDNWVIIDEANSDSTILEVPCNADGTAAEWWLGGSAFQWKASTLCFYGAWRRVLGYGAPVSCFIIRDIPGSLGCALWITDYATIKAEKSVPPTSPRTLGHEVGHASNLWHVCVDLDNQNLMATKTGTSVLSPCDPSPSSTEPDRAKPRMNNWQVLLVRASKHVTYF